ncbi:hypothetical protein P170DRAFT_361414, partial [Aspergillus steynii IBT 23096]
RHANLSGLRHGERGQKARSEDFLLPGNKKSFPADRVLNSQIVVWKSIDVGVWINKSLQKRGNSSLLDWRDIETSS